MLRNNLKNLEVLCCHTLITHVTGHAHALEYLCRVRAGTDRTGLTTAVVLTVGLLTYATKTVSLNDTLVAMTI